MAACMSQSRKSVIFRVEGNAPTPLAVGELGSERGAEVVRATSHLEALLFQVVGENLMGVNFFVAGLGVVIDLPLECQYYEGFA